MYDDILTAGPVVTTKPQSISSRLLNLVRPAIYLFATLTCAHFYLSSVWDNSLSLAMFPEGFIGTAMVALVLAISRPRVGEYSAFLPRLLWGLARAYRSVIDGSPYLRGPSDLLLNINIFTTRSQRSF